MPLQSTTIGILETGRPPIELLPTHGDYPGMVQDWLKKLDGTFLNYPVLDGKIPTDPSQADIWIITGSRFGAYEDHDWIPPLEDFIRSCYSNNRFMFGICFGHQIIAQALGGVVCKSHKGWCLGVHEYEVRDWPAEFGVFAEPLSIQAYHQDQIEELPSGALTIASSKACEHAALWYPGFALTVQGHPEFSTEYTGSLLEARRGAGLTDEDVKQGFRNLNRGDNSEALAKALINYINLRKTQPN